MTKMNTDETMVNNDAGASIKLPSPVLQYLLDGWEKVPSPFAYVFIGMVVFFVSTRVAKATSGHIFALIATYLIIQKLQQQESVSTMSFNQEMDYRLDLLGAPSHFHVDTNIINLFYNIYGWRDKNAYNFDNAIKAINNILKIEADSKLPLQRCVDNYEVAYDQRNIALNLMHGFIYSLDHPILVAKLKKVLVRLQELLERHLVAIQKNCENIENAKDGIDVNSRFIEDAHGPKPYDGASMTQFDYY